MAETTGFQAGIETDDTQISYAFETAWGTKPAVAFQAIRYTGTTLAGARTRQRPTEIGGTREASAAVTTQQTAGGTINIAMSYQTFDDFMAAALQNEWGTAAAINEVGSDITITNTAGVITISSTLAGKFTALAAGMWIKMWGFTNAANNALWYISIKTSDVLMTLTGPNSATAVTETPGSAAVKIRACTIKNGTEFRSLFLQQKLSSNMFLQYPGAYPSRMTITGGLGNFLTGTFDVVAKQETKATTDGSTGAVLAAPTGRVVNPVGGFLFCTWNEAALGAGVDRFTLTLENTGAASEFAMGGSGAQGILGGTFTASGTMRVYFKDFTLYDYYLAETAGRLAFGIQDPAGNSYVFTFLSATLNGKQVIGGPGQAAYLDFDIEGGPASGGGTLQIDRLAAT